MCHRRLTLKCQADGRDQDTVKTIDDALVAQFVENGMAQRLVITAWDYGGQSVFYALHHLFLTRYGVYLVVFNLEHLSAATSDALPSPFGHVWNRGTADEICQPMSHYPALWPVTRPDFLPMNSSGPEICPVKFQKRVRRNR